MRLVLRPFRACAEAVLRVPGRCPGLICFGLSGRSDRSQKALKVSAIGTSRQGATSVGSLVQAAELLHLPDKPEGVETGRSFIDAA